jgi:hypothetical protein
LRDYPPYKLVPITNISINSAGNYVFTVEDINDLRVSLPSGAFYGPYLPIVLPNDKLYSVIPFFGSSIFTPIYYNISLDSITLPNRPIKSLSIPGTRSWNDIPFFYVSIYPVDDEENYDPNIKAKYVIIGTRHIIGYEKHETVIEVATSSSISNYMTSHVGQTSEIMDY